jgi:pimeloyl-ACP methyl ester carboxylesterase
VDTARVSVTEHTHTAGGHTSFYLAAGPEAGPLIVFVHGWPELSISWRHQLPVFGALGFRALAPDMRGYGRSSVYPAHGDYAQERVVGDMLALIDAQGRDKAVWVGHDWGTATVWLLAAHHADRCHGVANLCVPYASLERGLDALVAGVDRDVYPTDEFPLGPWDYQAFYEESFADAQRELQADAYKTIKLLFRSPDPSALRQPAATARVRANGGWFFGLGEAPDVPRDPDVVSEVDLRAYASALERNGFFGPCSYYMNHAANAAYAAGSPNEGFLDLPVLFLAAKYDFVCECVNSPLAEPMRKYCRNLTERIVASGHWMAQEKPVELNAALVGWLATSLADVWPGATA